MVTVSTGSNLGTTIGTDEIEDNSVTLTKLSGDVIALLFM